jgi:hypothetical protein
LPENLIRHITETQADAAIEFIDEAEEQDKPFFVAVNFA